MYHVMKTVDGINNEIDGNHFQIQLFKESNFDDGFELYVHEKSDLSDTGKLIYSKKASGKYPHSDDQEFEKLLTMLRVVTQAKWATINPDEITKVMEAA